MKANAKSEFADFLMKRLSEGGLTYVEVDAAALIARVRGWNRKGKKKTRRKTGLHIYKVGDEITQNGAQFTVEEVCFGQIVSVKDSAGVVHRKEKS